MIAMTTTNTTALLPVAKLSEAGFVPDDFATFAIDGLERRMAAIQSRIQPKFRALGERLTHELMPAAGDELFLHIAKHARRTVNAPKDTWMALCSNKRGYKQHPHFQLGLFDDHLFLWLAFIYELPNKSEIASALLGELDTVIRTVPIACGWHDGVGLARCANPLPRCKIGGAADRASYGAGECGCAKRREAAAGGNRDL
jgi:hypothetical protein